MIQEKIDYSKLEESKIIVDEVLRRFKAGLNTNIYVIGLSGTGKSSASIRIGELIKEQNGGQMFITDSLLEVLGAIKKSNEGDILIVEEVSVLFPSRRSMAHENVAVNKIFDTVRKKRLCIISNAPILPSIDSHMRGMGHILIETKGIRKREQVVVSKVLLMQTNAKSGKTYWHTFCRCKGQVRNR